MRKPKDESAAGLLNNADEVGQCPWRELIKISSTLKRENLITDTKVQTRCQRNFEEIEKIAGLRPIENFTSLACLINEGMTLTCHEELEKGKAVAID